LVSVNLFEFILDAVLRSAALLTLRNILRKWFVTAVLIYPHMSCNLIEFCVGFLQWFRSNSFAYFSSLPRSSNISMRRTLGRIGNSYSFR